MWLVCSNPPESHSSKKEGNSFCLGDAFAGLGGEEELQVEYKWEGADVPGIGDGTQKHELSPISSGCLPLSPTVGGSGSRITGPEAKAGKVSPPEAARPREPWHIQEPPS